MNKDTELIALYLRNELNAADKQNFEARLQQEPNLREQLELQKQLLQGIEQAGKRAEVKAGVKSAKVNKTLKKIGTWTVIAIAAAAAGIAINKYANESSNNIKYDLNEENQASWTQADKVLPSQQFEINTETDTVLTSKDGLLFAIPAVAFVDSKGKPVQGKIEIEVKEALTPLDIMKAGLSTMSNERALETGGMFYINARKGNENLKIKSDKAITAAIPNMNQGKDMQLFDGVRSQNYEGEGHVAVGYESKINWVNPRGFESKLSTRDILQLNFYPPGFLDTLKAMGFDIKNKQLTDSIYYSISCERNYSEERYVATADSAVVMYDMEGNQYTIVPKEHVAPQSFGPSCEIDPMRIKAIWKEDYNGTLLATKEFEKRLAVIFKTCNAGILDIYTKGLNLKLYQCDSIAAERLRLAGNHSMSEKFTQFYLEKKGGLLVNEKHLQKLNEVLDQNTQTYKAARDKALQKLYGQEQIVSNAAFEKRFKHDTAEGTRLSNVLQQEINMNLEEAYRQLGKTKPKFVLPGDAYLTSTIVVTGWKNVDAYVTAATIARSSMTYIDPESFKKAEINYLPFKIQVQNEKDFDRINAYLLPKQLNSFNRMRELSPSEFELSLNEFIAYDALVLGFKGDQVFSAKIENCKKGTFSLKLKSSSATELANLERFGNTIKEDIEFAQFDIKEEKRLKKINDREVITERLRRVVFPCYAAQAQPQYN